LSTWAGRSLAMSGVLPTRRCRFSRSVETLADCCRCAGIGLRLLSAASVPVGKWSCDRWTISTTLSNSTGVSLATTSWTGRVSQISSTAAAYFLFGRPFSPSLLRLHPPGTPGAYAAFKRIGGDFCSRDPRFTGQFWGSFAASHAISLMACAITLSLAQHRLPISLRRPSTLTDRHMPLGRSRGMPGWVLVRDHVAHSPAAVKQNPRVAPAPI
jgi:hypothetical protein